MKKPMSIEDKRSLQKYNKKIVQICKKTNKIIKTYISIRSACFENGIDRSNLKRALTKDSFSAGGYRWMLYEQWILLEPNKNKI